MVSSSRKEFPAMRCLRPPGKLESCGSWMENYPLDAPVELSTHGGFRTAVSLD